MQEVMAAIVAAGLLAGATAASALTPPFPPEDGPIRILCESHPRLCEKMGVMADDIRVPFEDAEGRRSDAGA